MQKGAEINFSEICTKAADDMGGRLPLCSVVVCVLLVFRLFCCLYMVEDTGEQFFRHQL